MGQQYQAHLEDLVSWGSNAQQLGRCYSFPTSSVELVEEERGLRQLQLLSNDELVPSHRYRQLVVKLLREQHLEFFPAGVEVTPRLPYNSLPVAFFQALFRTTPPPPAGQGLNLLLESPPVETGGAASAGGSCRGAAGLTEPGLHIPTGPEGDRQDWLGLLDRARDSQAGYDNPAQGLWRKYLLLAEGISKPYRYPTSAKELRQRDIQLQLLKNAVGAVPGGVHAYHRIIRELRRNLKYYPQIDGWRGPLLLTELPLGFIQGLCITYPPDGSNKVVAEMVQSAYTQIMGTLSPTIVPTDPRVELFSLPPSPPAPFQPHPSGKVPPRFRPQPPAGGVGMGHRAPTSGGRCGDGP